MENYTNGDFKAVGFSEHEVEMLSCAFRTITELDLWDWLKTWSPPADRGWTWCDPPDELKRINIGMKYDDWTGMTYGWTMRNMSSIAKEGWDQWSFEYAEGLAREKARVSTVLRSMTVGCTCGCTFCCCGGSYSDHDVFEPLRQENLPLRSTSFLSQVEQEE